MSSGRPYPRSASRSACENLPPKTLARVSREIRDLHKEPPEGVRLVVDADTGVPNNLGEVLVSPNERPPLQVTLLPGDISKLSISVEPISNSAIHVLIIYGIIAGTRGREAIRSASHRIDCNGLSVLYSFIKEILFVAVVVMHVSFYASRCRDPFSAF